MRAAAPLFAVTGSARYSRIREFYSDLRNQGRSAAPGQPGGVQLHPEHRQVQPGLLVLVASALTEKVAEYAEAAEQALAVADPWVGFAGFVQRICELQAGDRGLSDLLSMTLSADEHVEQFRRTANDRVITLIDRAKSAGALREDFAGEDLVLLLIATAGVMHVTRADAPGAWRRFVALALDAFRCRDSAGLPAAPTKAAMTRAMLRLAAERGCRERR